MNGLTTGESQKALFVQFVFHDFNFKISSSKGDFVQCMWPTCHTALELQLMQGIYKVSLEYCRKLEVKCKLHISL